MEIHCVKSQICNHSNKVPISKDFKRSTDLSSSSNVWVFRSLQISHIKQASTIFQMIHPWKKRRSEKRREATVLGITHWIPNVRYIYIYIMLVYYKCLLNWSLVDYVPSHVYNKYTFYSFIMHIQKSSTNCSITYNIYQKDRKSVV